MYLQNQLIEIESLIKDADKLDQNISSVSIGWQLDHTLRVINGVCYSLVMSEPKEYKKDFNWSRVYIFNIKRIPRGREKAPKQVTAQEEITKVTLEDQLEKAKKLIVRLSLLDKNAFMQHHVFGNLNVKNSITFLEIHTHHHLKIAKEIL